VGWWGQGTVCGQEKAAAMGSANNLYRQTLHYKPKETCCLTTQ